jgi:hypothetical protein
MRQLVVGLVSFAVGVIVALVFAAVFGHDPEREESLRLRELAAKHSVAESDFALSKSQGEIDELHDELDASTKRGDEMAVNFLMANAFIYMLMNEDGRINIDPITSSPRFRKMFSASWYKPHVAFELIGSAWLLDDMRKCGVLSNKDYQAIREQCDRTRAGLPVPEGFTCPSLHDGED